MSGLAEPFALMKHKAARFAAGWFHQQAIGAMVQTFPNMFEMRKNVFFRDSHQGGDVFGRHGPLPENLDHHLTDRLGHCLSPVVPAVSFPRSAVARAAAVMETA